MFNALLLAGLSATLMFCQPALAAQAADDLSDEEWAALEVVDVSHVNEGELHFLDSLPAGKPVHRHINHLRLLPESLRSGWIAFEQCHEHLDAVPSLQVVFRPGRVDHLQLVESRHIEQAWVEGHSVQLTNIQGDARLCLAGRMRLVSIDAQGQYTLKAGPFMRRFLDGFYPMQVIWTIDSAGSGIRMGRVTPSAQQGFKIQREDNRIEVEAQFEGRLMITLNLSPKPE